LFYFNRDIEKRKYVFSFYVPNQEKFYIDDFSFNSSIETKVKKIKSKTFKILIDTPTMKYVSVKNLDDFYIIFKTDIFDTEKIIENIKSEFKVKKDYDHGMLFEYEYYKDIFHKEYLESHILILEDYSNDDVIIPKYEKLIRSIGEYYVNEQDYIFCEVVINGEISHTVGINIFDIIDIVKKENVFDDLIDLKYSDTHAEFQVKVNDNIIEDEKIIKIKINEKR